MKVMQGFLVSKNQDLCWRAEGKARSGTLGQSIESEEFLYDSPNAGKTVGLRSTYQQLKENLRTRFTLKSMLDTLAQATATETLVHRAGERVPAVSG